VVQDEKLKGSGTTEIINGLSCMVCHKDGMIGVPKDEVRDGSALDDSEFTKKIRFIYVPTPMMNKLIDRDRRRFQAAVKEAIGSFLGEEDKKKAVNFWPEPIYEVVAKYYHEPVTLETAAYELGYKTPDKLKAACEISDKLNQLGMRGMAKGGTITRDQWDYADRFEQLNDPKRKEDVGDSAYQQAATELKLGQSRR